MHITCIYTRILPGKAHLRLLELGKLRLQVVHDALGGAGQHEAPHEQNAEYDVGHGGGDPDDLARRLDPLEERHVEHQVDGEQAEHQLPLGVAHLVEALAPLHLQDAAAGTGGGSRIGGMISGALRKKRYKYSFSNSA